MKQELLQILQHSLGVDEFGEGEQYRNHFCAGIDDLALCRELKSLGLMDEFPPTKFIPYPTFVVTRIGKDAMKEASPRAPKLTRGQERYRRWLDVSDVCDISFGEWLKRMTRPEVQP
jgi:hypothetical protein